MRERHDGSTGIWAPGWKDTPYWLDGLDAPPDCAVALPPAVDVLVIGAGYTGLNAAIETARGGRATLVIDAAAPGAGCSTRNGGQISTSIKPSLAKLSAKYGEARARAIRAEGETALCWIEQRIAAESIDCGFNRVGRFHAAHSPAAYDRLAREAEDLTRQEGIEAFAVPRSESRAELAAMPIMAGRSFRATHRLTRRAFTAGSLRRCARRARKWWTIARP